MPSRLFYASLLSIVLLERKLLTRELLVSKLLPKKSSLNQEMRPKRQFLYLRNDIMASTK